MSDRDGKVLEAGDSVEWVLPGAESKSIPSTVRADDGDGRYLVEIPAVGEPGADPAALARIDGVDSALMEKESDEVWRLGAAKLWVVPGEHLVKSA